MPRLPVSRTQLRLGAFHAFLVGRRANFMPCQEGQLIHFQVPESARHSWIGETITSSLIWVGDAAVLYLELLAAVPDFQKHRSNYRPGQPTTQKKRVLIDAVIKRDGRICFYCSLPIPHGEETLEHLVPTCEGGSNKLANLAVSHVDCNCRAGRLPVIEKVKLRDELRGLK